jgi:hypothetical protein
MWNTMGIVEVAFRAAAKGAVPLDRAAVEAGQNSNRIVSPGQKVR